MERFNLNNTFVPFLSGLYNKIIHARIDSGNVGKGCTFDIKFPITPLTIKVLNSFSTAQDSIGLQYVKNEQCLTKDSKNLILAFLKDRHTSKKLKSLIPIINSTKVGTYFQIMSYSYYERLSDIECSDMYFHISARNSGQSPYKRSRQDTYFLHHYHPLAARGKNGMTIGDSPKKGRICRYCNRKNGVVSFNMIAHTISEALGNKTIITIDECDSCNRDFSNGIEKDCIRYFDLVRTLFQIRGKVGTPTYTGNNFIIKPYDNHVRLIYANDYYDFALDNQGAPYIIASSQQSLLLPIKFYLKTQFHVILQNVYKMLCKYAIGTMDTNVLPAFKETIHWITSNTFAKHLPFIYCTNDNPLYDEHPSIIYYIRKTNDPNLPFAFAEFYFSRHVYTYIIPIFSTETKGKRYESFWEKYLTYRSTSHWIREDMTPSTSALLTNTLEIYS